MNTHRTELKSGDRAKYRDTVIVRILRGDNVRIDLDSGLPIWIPRENIRTGSNEDFKVGDRITYNDTVTVHIVRENDVRIELDSGEEFWTSRENLEFSDVRKKKDI
ncbi:hypothetical protein HCB37_16750 [Listeria booriae]|uniref:SH3 domain-containing protein n=1 Tax=Listeria TaxID=1637 RepID=UPI00162413C8|nr:MULTISPECIES: SH3 domain-containing protein [Listeria]MBC1850904.1 hypothetical protein [Listeria seeligeri]MBC1899100.1 hypothetical protein [Listeria booriae]MBC2266153.1 hypothetical protein [Listeria booriae]